MASNKVPGIQSGPFGSEAIVANYIANAAINIGAVVTDAAAGTGEYSTRVSHGTTTSGTLRGVVIGGDARGTYATTGYAGTAATQACSAAGQGAQVCISGRCLVLVNGSTASIAVSDPLTADPNNAGFAVKAAAAGFVVARALQASTLFGDYILCDVVREGIL